MALSQVSQVNFWNVTSRNIVAVIFPPRNRARVIAAEFPLLKVGESYIICGNRMDTIICDFIHTNMLIQTLKMFRLSQN